MNRSFAILASLLIASTLQAQQFVNPQELFLQRAEQIESEKFDSLPVHDRGRIKPFQTFARESILFITGSYSFEHKNAVQVYLSLMRFNEIARLKIINVRHAPVRKALGLIESERYFSPNDLDSTKLMELAGPLFEKQQRNKRSLEPHEKNLIEIYSQYALLKQIFSGEHFLRAIDAHAIDEKEEMHGGAVNSELQELARSKLQQLTVEGSRNIQTGDLKEKILAQNWPSPLNQQLNNIDTELSYNKWRPFFIAAILFIIIGLMLILYWPKTLFNNKRWAFIFALPFVPLIVGFYQRVSITGFAPVTNMYGTMLWVSFGIGLFSLLVWFLYRRNVFVGSLWVAVSGLLLLTESLPLVLSPDLDPIVAVLRSNLWLTIHVLTIVISYAAFAITMVLGNMVLVRSIVTGHYKDSYVQDAATTCYRMIQLGVFLISVGIVLGGIWADYSWGRFWGWDPKETWALIADLGYLAILHARYVGWLGAFGVLASSTLGFLLVIMAWYGVNFILGAGLHSYGFSSGGAAMVLTFVIIQLAVLALAVGLYFQRKHATR